MVELPDWAYARKRIQSEPASTIIVEGRTTSYGLEALNAECERVANAPRHTANDTLNRASFQIGRLSAGGEIAEPEARAALYAAAYQRGIPRGETERTFNSGFSAGRNEPRSAPKAIDAPRIRWSKSRIANDQPAVQKGPAIVAIPFKYSPAAIPKREWLYGNHLIRGFVSATVAPGGIGKTSLVLAEAVAMAAGRSILGVAPASEPLNVWILNLEDPPDEITRRISAIVIHSGLKPEAIAGRLYVTSSFDTAIVLARKDGETIAINEPAFEQLAAELKKNKIDILLIDPFIGCHEISENDNKTVDALVKRLAALARQANCAIELVHHSRKLNGENATVESVRGASAFVAACRDVRLLRRMEPGEASKLGVADHFRYVCIVPAKHNMAPAPRPQVWYEMQSVELPSGDSVGVTKPWSVPDPSQDATAEQLRLVQAAFHTGRHRANEQASEWGGYAVADILGLEIGRGVNAAERTASQRAGRAKVKALLRKLLADGLHFRQTRPRCGRGTGRPFFDAPANSI